MCPAVGINHGVNIPAPMTAFSLVRKLIPVLLLMPATLMPQVIDIRDARTSVSVENLQPAPVLPSAKLTATSAGEVALLPGLFRERRELTKAYLLRLKSAHARICKVNVVHVAVNLQRQPDHDPVALQDLG